MYISFAATWFASNSFANILLKNIAQRKKKKETSWPLVGNEGMNPQYTNVKVDSLIPY